MPILTKWSDPLANINSNRDDCAFFTKIALSMDKYHGWDITNNCWKWNKFEVLFGRKKIPDTIWAMETTPIILRICTETEF